ncbi:hypothetical protein MLD38_020722 [Melastoma candidum]|uniref:Uncharacterized protein n=1 Tax=Melastoma candidum TaxID=119954 RepID=A0ACB9QDR9_9MYRT|nr:hypothetical protein MLD38_020722 [Melastoma candidum]
MGRDKVVVAILSFSLGLAFCIPCIRRQQRQEIVSKGLRIVLEALEHAEERLAMSWERHDVLLRQRCSFYLTNCDLEEALADARKAIEEATELTRVFGRMQMRLIASFTKDVDVENQRRSR